MDSSEPTVRLLDEVAEGGYRASIITTYNCYFPFYEEVVLRRLMSAGCLHNILMVDAAQCATAFASPDLRPRRAGRDYTIIPVALSGAFHPKLILRLGQSKGALHVGSHNMTLSGFGLNDEVTTAFHFQKGGSQSDVQPFIEALAYLAQFVPKDLEEVASAFDALRLGIPWLRTSKGSVDDRQLLMSGPSGEHLWTRLAPLVPREPQTVFVCAPFFDGRLAFIRHLMDEIRPKRLVIGIDPDSVSIDPREAEALPNVEWRNVGGMPLISDRRQAKTHSLHAKILRFTTPDGEVLVVGSANPTAAAYLAPAASRNAEAIVVDRRPGASERLGLSALLDSPPVAAGDWRTIEHRRQLEADEPELVGRHVCLAVPTAEGFRADRPLPAGLVLTGRASTGDIGEAVALGSHDIRASESVRAQAQTLESDGDEDRWVVLVHRDEDISRNIGTGNSKAVVAALHALDSDPGQIADLVRLVEKVIFDSDFILVEKSTSISSRLEAAPPPSYEWPSSLAVDARGRVISRRARAVASGDILVLIDALIRRLSQGLPEREVMDAAAEGTSVSRSYEAEGDPDELSVVPSLDATSVALARACRSRVRVLVKRACEQLELARTRGGARRAIVQLSAVLSTIHLLRRTEGEANWRALREELVATDDLRRLFESAATGLAWGSASLAEQATAESEGQPFEELSLALGKLLWAAWDVGAPAPLNNNLSPWHDRPRTDKETMYLLQLVTAVCARVASDDRAMAIASDAIERSGLPRPGERNWLQNHFSHAEIVAELEQTPLTATQSKSRPTPGDLVVLADGNTPRVRVVLDVGRVNGHETVEFFAPETPKGRATFLASRLLVVPWEANSVQ